ncbi:hypothetical protein KL935_003676 [Ogataea polymorpha]|nr:hypothetical protein KL908_003715 [Ogataea polymorpha]KAG7899366.1 hypothetical protein KL935_003676 [Ogataea polymorpha]KAG7907641.1 hypothetical protein KL906_003722 [Ogataea polymorpha]KAG7915573.1 hypothetical protein KL927_003849 [Ogataea polymorpha]
MADFNQRRAKLYNSRLIRAEVSDPAFTAAKDPVTGVTAKLDVEKFVQSREFEIKEFELSKLRSRYSSATRVFQSLPRSMRRRTASHNVRRVPKRLRTRALREMGLSKKEPDGNETKGVDRQGRPSKAKHSRGRELYRLRRQEKLLRYAARLKLSGHLVDGERVNVRNVKMRAKLKALRDRIQELSQSAETPLNNVCGSVDWTGINERATIGKVSAVRYISRQREFKWLPTHVWHAKRAHMVKRWGWNIAYEPTMKCFRQTSRQSRTKGCIGFDTSFYTTIVLKGEGLGKVVGTLTNGKALLKKYVQNGRIWEGFVELDDELLCHSMVWWIKNGKECVLRIHPSVYDRTMDYLLSKRDDIEIQDSRYSIGSITVTGPQALCSLASIIHPSSEAVASQLFRQLSTLNSSAVPLGTTFGLFADDPRLWPRPTKPHTKPSDPLETIIQLQNGAGVEVSAVEALFSVEGRVASYAGQPSLKQLGRRRTPELVGRPIPKTDSDPSIPIVLAKLQCGFVLLTPWHWVLPFWHQLAHTPHFAIGGLKQLAQLEFEKGELSFADCAFTRAGFVEGLAKMEELEARWAKRPKSKRVNYDKLDEPGSPFGCDWRYLQLLRQKLKQVPPVEDYSGTEFTITQERVIRNKQDVFEAIEDQKEKDRLITALGKPVFTQLPIKLVGLTQQPDAASSRLPVVAVKFRMVNRGHPADNARIYAIPEESYLRWIEEAGKKTILGNTVPFGLECPGKEYLIGYATSATFNLAVGKGTGVGLIDAEVAYDLHTKNRHTFVVRNVASTACYLAEWTLVAV